MPAMAVPRPITSVRVPRPGGRGRPQVMALPTLIVFTGGRETKRVTGTTTKAQLPAN